MTETNGLAPLQARTAHEDRAIRLLERAESALREASMELVTTTNVLARVDVASRLNDLRSAVRDQRDVLKAMAPR